MRKSQVTESTRLRRQGFFMVAATLALLLLTSWVAVHWDLDRAIAARFYTPGKGWLEKEAQPWLSALSLRHHSGYRPDPVLPGALAGFPFPGPRKGDGTAIFCWCF